MPCRTISNLTSPLLSLVCILSTPSLLSFVHGSLSLFRLMMGYFGPPWFIDVRDYDVDTDGIVYDADFLDDSDTFFLPLSDIIPTVPCKFRDLTVPCPRNSEAVIVVRLHKLLDFITF